jgi:hypothetical protein
VSQDIHDGKGLSVFRGLDRSRYSQLDNVLIYLGITSYFAVHLLAKDDWVFDGYASLHLLVPPCLTLPASLSVPSRPR